MKESKREKIDLGVDLEKLEEVFGERGRYYAKYLKLIVEDWSAHRELAESLYHRLLAGEDKEVDKGLLSDLEQRSRIAHITFSGRDLDVASARVNLARAQLYCFFLEERDFLDKNGLLVTYYGSLQYRDPRNLDADVLIICTGDSYKEGGVREKIGSYQDELDSIWKQNKLGLVPDP